MPIRHNQKRQLPPANPPPALVEINVTELTIVQPDGPHTFILKEGTEDSWLEKENGDVEIFHNRVRHSLLIQHIYRTSIRYYKQAVPASLFPHTDPA